MASLEWTDAAIEQLGDTLVWLAVHRGVEVAEEARAALDATVQAAAQRPLAYPWVGAIFPGVANADQSYRRVLAWHNRLHVYYRYATPGDRVIVLHVRGTRQRPLSLLELTRSV